MSVFQFQETGRAQGEIENARGAVKCRIPQKLSLKKTSVNSNFRPKGQNPDIVLHPKSENRVKEEVSFGRPGYPACRAVRAERLNAVLKRPPNQVKRMQYDTTIPGNKAGKPTYIIVPNSSSNQRAPGQSHPKPMYNTKPVHPNELPDQETIEQSEDLELRLSPTNSHYNSYEDKESLTSRGDKLVQLKIAWQDKIIQYENNKQDLKDKQRAVLELYAALRSTHQEMRALGEENDLPSADELQIMNVCKLTPEQLLHLCSEHNNLSGPCAELACHISVDMSKVSNIPGKLINAAEQTLHKRKEIIEWFSSLLTKGGGISIQHLERKINKFDAENDMLHGSLDQLKIELQKEMEEIIQCLRKSANDSMSLQLRTEQLTYELAELNSQNADLRKRIQTAESMRSYSNKYKMEELEKELKEEKCKRILIKNQLTRAEGQLKINIERASQLEGALEQARSQTWNLERKVQQLHDQNQKLQNDYDKELSKWSESMKLLESHTAHIEEIAKGRERLQTEKEDLEKKLTELSNSYNESLNNVKCDLNTNTAKLIEAEKNYELSCQEKKKLETQVESLCTQLCETELRLKDTVKQVEEKCTLQSELNGVKKELDYTKRELETYYAEIEEYRKAVTNQNETISEGEKKITMYLSIEQSLKEELSTKDEYIAELEKKLVLLEEQLLDNENKMEAYVSQLTSLKNHITQLQEEFGEFQNMDELHEMINKQRDQLVEATRQNSELVEALQKKEEELEQYASNLAEHEQMLEQRDGIIKMFSIKEEEQTNIIKILRNNLELRSQADNDLNQQVMEKNAEIESLIANVETRKKQVCNLEKIILTLEDQTRKANIQRRKDQDKIEMLQKRLADFENYLMESGHRGLDLPAENLDNLIKKLEDELGVPLEPQMSEEHDIALPKKKYNGDRKRDNEMHDGENNVPMYRSQANPTKIVMGNFVKKTYITKEDQYQGDNLDRKKAITSIDMQRWASANSTNNSVQSPGKDTNIRGIIPNLKCNTPYTTRNLQALHNPIRDERKNKMFKFAGHRLS